MNDAHFPSNVVYFNGEKGAPMLTMHDDAQRCTLRQEPIKNILYLKGILATMHDAQQKKKRNIFLSYCMALAWHFPRQFCEKPFSNALDICLQ